MKSILILLISVLVILAFLLDLGLSWTYIKDNMGDELPPILAKSVVLVPAILGLVKFKQGPINTLIFGGFVLYGLLTVGAYVNAFMADDPLAAGLPMVMFVIPFSILFSIFLVIQIRKQAKVVA